MPSPSPGDSAPRGSSSDGRLLARARGGSRSAVDVLFAQYGAWLRRGAACRRGRAGPSTPATWSRTRCSTRSRGSAGSRAGYLHGDVEPSNIGSMLSGLPKLLDFGLAREPNDADTQGGTLRYLSPEVLSGLPAEQADDVWSLCVVLHEMVAGAHPFATTELDADRVELTDALRRFTRRSAGADVSLVFYAGHGKAIQGRATCSRTAAGQRFTWSNRASPENPGARRDSQNRGARSRRERRPRPQVTAKAIPRRGSGHARRPPSGRVAPVAPTAATLDDWPPTGGGTTTRSDCRRDMSSPRLLGSVSAGRVSASSRDGCSVFDSLTSLDSERGCWRRTGRP